MPENLKAFYEKERGYIGHRVMLNLRAIPYREVNGVIKDLEIAYIDRDDPWNSWLNYVIETDEGIERHDMIRDVQGISDLGVAEELDRICELDGTFPGDIKTIDDVADYMNPLIQGIFVGRLHKGHPITTFDEEFPDINYLAREIKKAVKNGIISWGQLHQGSTACHCRNEQEFDQWLTYRSS